MPKFEFRPVSSVFYFLLTIVITVIQTVKYAGYCSISVDTWFASFVSITLTSQRLLYLTRFTEIIRYFCRDLSQISDKRLASRQRQDAREHVLEKEIDRYAVQMKRYFKCSVLQIFIKTVSLLPFRSFGLFFVLWVYNKFVLSRSYRIWIFFSECSKLFWI